MMALEHLNRRDRRDFAENTEKKPCFSLRPLRLCGENLEGGERDRLNEGAAKVKRR